MTKHETAERLKRQESRDKLILALRALHGTGDTESQHASADRFLMDWIAETDPELAEAYDAVDKWYA